ncbi:MAG: thiamine-phosphate kinase [Phycisphaeraceae bacterium]|nr:thiamine-phosphate kinase [Phycisphaeraceae bacterium]
MREMAILQHIYEGNAAMPAEVVLPPGDDMGGLRVVAGTLLVTVDQLIDGIHFDLHNTPLEKVARKAITRNLSDVAAMAALPRGAVASAALPRDFGQDRAESLVDAMRQVALHYHCPLFGGDLSVWDHPLHLSVTVLAEPAGVEPVLRRGAMSGDHLYVTGTLGGSLIDVRGRVHHLDFEPRLDLARTLASDPATRPHAMLDLSDGLAQDAGHLAAAAGLVVEIDVTRLPVSEASRIAASRSGKLAWQHALGDGEDYELCFAAAAPMPANRLDVPITDIGRFRACLPGETSCVMLVLPDGRRTSAAGLGWEHQGS